MKNLISTLKNKKWNVVIPEWKFSIPYGRIILMAFPALLFVLFYKITLLLLNVHSPDFIMENRHFIRIHFPLVYHHTYGTMPLVFFFFLTVSFLIFSLLGKHERGN